MGGTSADSGGSGLSGCGGLGGCCASSCKPGAGRTQPGHSCPVSTYGKYYAEILRTEGLNAFAVADIGTVTATTLGAYDVVVLAPATLTAAQVSIFTSWVNAGGNLIAIRPDSQPLPLLALPSASPPLPTSYL